MPEGTPISSIEGLEAELAKTAFELEIDRFLFKKDNIAIVDGTNGNNGTASIGGLPYLTFEAAATAAKAAYDLTTDKKFLVYIRAFEGYYSVITGSGDHLYPEIHYFAEPKAIIRSSGTSNKPFGDFTNGAGNYWIHGKGEWYIDPTAVFSNTFAFSYASNVFLSASVVQNFGILEDFTINPQPRAKCELHIDKLLTTGNRQSNPTKDLRGGNIKFYNTDFIGGDLQGGFWQRRQTIDFDRCKFRLSPTVHNQTNGVWNVVDKAGNALFSVDMTDTNMSRQSRLADFSLFANVQANVDSDVIEHERGSCVEYNLDNDCYGLKHTYTDCEFHIDQDKGIGFKVRKDTDLDAADPSIFKLIRPRFIDESGLTTTAIVAYKTSDAYSDPEIIVEQPVSNADVYRTSHSVPATNPDIEIGNGGGTIPSLLVTKAWYVSMGGNDANDGSPQSPFRTIGKAITDSSAGDTIHIQVGAYNETITIDKHLILIGSQFANQGSSSPETTVGITSLTIGANGSGASITGIFATGGLVVTEPSGVTICSINQCFFSGLSTITATTGFLLIDIKDTIFANQLILSGDNVYLDAYDLNITNNLTIANCDAINLYNCTAKAQVVLTGSAIVSTYDGYIETLASFNSPATLTIHGTAIYTDSHSGSGTGTLTQKVPWSSGGTTWQDYRYIDPDNGQDNTDAGSPQSPYASLSYAESQAGTDDTFVLMNGSATGGTFDRSFKLIALNGNFLTTTITIDCNVAARTVEFEGVNFTNTTIAKFGANNLTIIFKNCHGTLTDLTADDLEFYNCTLEKLTSVRTYDTAIINASKITLTGTITIGTSFTLSNSYLVANLSGTATLTLHNSEQEGTIAGTITVDSGEAQPLYSDIVAVTTNTTVNFDENVGALVEVSSSAICTVGLRGTPNSDNLTIGDYMDVIDRGTAEVGVNTSTSSGGAINGTRPSLGFPKKPNVKNRIYRYVYLGSDTFIVSDVEEATIQVTLTQAQIQALSTTPIDAIPAQGAGIYIEILSASAFYDYNTAAFVTGQKLEIVYNGQPGIIFETSTSFITDTADRFEHMVATAAPRLSHANTAVQVTANSDSTGGNAASTMTVLLKYRVHTLP